MEETISKLSSSASSHAPTEWASINWKRAQANVRAMQTRLTKATQDSNWRRVKALQRMLTRSFSAKALAVRRVTENQGKRTAGVDGELWDTPQKKHAVIARMKKHRYRPSPLRRVYIPKSNGKERPLGIPTMRDRAMQALYLLALDPVLEAVSDPNSYGFRKHRCTADAMSQIFVRLSQKTSATWVLDADIEGFFDHINHQWMLDHVLMDKEVLGKWLKSGVVDRGQFTDTEEGTPQGGIISPALANWTLNGLESQLIAELEAKWGVSKTRKMKVGVVRYADDFVITGASQEILETQIRPWVAEFLSQRGLRLSESKTRIVHINQGFDFLGWNFRKYSDKLLIKPTRKNVKAFYQKISDIISGSLGLTQETLLQLLNPMLRGWAQYHSPVVAKDTFSFVDALIFWRLTRWAKRRHPKKAARWIRKKYWRTAGNRNWVFSATSVTEDGKKIPIELYQLAGTPIVRHKKVKGAYNPYDPKWELDSETLHQERMLTKMRYRQEWSKLFVSQRGLCALCGFEIDWDTGWHDHHIEYRVNDGPHTLSNRVLLHPDCHRQVHSLKIPVVKPASV
jgi:RNA-directed DNA polymerase